jgi:hypothetical protein
MIRNDSWAAVMLLLLVLLWEREKGIEGYLSAMADDGSEAEEECKEAGILKGRHLPWQAWRGEKSLGNRN